MKPSLAAQPREGLIDGKPASETLGKLRGVNDAPGNLADLRKIEAGSRPAAIDAARNESAGNASVTRRSVIDRINKERESKGLTPFDDNIYKDIANADKLNNELSPGEREDDIAQRTSALRLQNQTRYSEAAQATKEKLSKMTPGETRDLARQYSDKVLDKSDPVLARERARDREADEYMTAEEKRKRDRKA